MHRMERSRNVDAATIRLIAVLSSSDPRTVVKVLRGKRVRGMADGRIRDAMSRLGLPPAETEGEPRS